MPITLRMCEDGVLEAFVEDIIEGLRYLNENPTKTTKTSAFYHMLQTVRFEFLYIFSSGRMREIFIGSCKTLFLASLFCNVRLTCLLPKWGVALSL